MRVVYSSSTEARSRRQLATPAAMIEASSSGQARESRNGVRFSSGIIDVMKVRSRRRLGLHRRDAHRSTHRRRHGSDATRYAVTPSRDLGSGGTRPEREKLRGRARKNMLTTGGSSGSNRLRETSRW